MGLGSNILRITNLCLGLFYSFSLEEPIHLRQGRDTCFLCRHFKLQKSQKGFWEERIKVYISHKTYSFKVFKVAGIWFEVHYHQCRPIPTDLSGDTEHLLKCNWRILLFWNCPESNPGRSHLRININLLPPINFQWWTHSFPFQLGFAPKVISLKSPSQPISEVTEVMSSSLLVL